MARGRVDGINIFPSLLDWISWSGRILDWLQKMDKRAVILFWPDRGTVESWGTDTKTDARATGQSQRTHKIARWIQPNSTETCLLRHTVKDTLGAKRRRTRRGRRITDDDRLVKCNQTIQKQRNKTSKTRQPIEKQLVRLCCNITSSFRSSLLLLILGQSLW